VFLVGQVTNVKRVSDKFVLVKILETATGDVIETGGNDSAYSPGEKVVLNVNANLREYKGRAELKFWREGRFDADQVKKIFGEAFAPSQPMGAPSSSNGRAPASV